MSHLRTVTGTDKGGSNEEATKEHQLEFLLKMFEQLQNLFTSDDNEAQALRGSLKRLIDEEMYRNPTKIGKLKLALRLVLLCPSLISVKGREGYEWIGEVITEALENHAMAQGSGRREGSFYANDEVVGGQRWITRRYKTLRSIINSVFHDLEKDGRPAEQARDLQRASFVHIGQQFFRYTKTQALRFAAAMEAYVRGGDEAREKRLRINIGTDKRPKFVEFGARSTSRPSGKKSETFEPTEVATERQVALSLRRIEKRKYIIKEFVQRSAAFAEDYHGPIAAIHEEILGRTGLELNNLITPDESS